MASGAAEPLFSTATSSSVQTSDPPDPWLGDCPPPPVDPVCYRTHGRALRHLTSLRSVPHSDDDECSVAESAQLSVTGHPTPLTTTTAVRNTAATQGLARCGKAVPAPGAHNDPTSTCSHKQACRRWGRPSPTQSGQTHATRRACCRVARAPHNTATPHAFQRSRPSFSRRRFLVFAAFRAAFDLFFLCRNAMTRGQG